MNISLDKREGSFINNMISPIGVELAKTYIEFGNILNIAFVKSNYDEYLDLKCGEWGIERKEGKKSTGYITFFGEDGYVVTNGIECKTSSGLVFITTEEGTIKDGTVTLAAESVDEGSIYNVALNTITEFVYPVIGVDSLTNENAFENGVDRESDNELIERFYHKVRTPAISGNVYHYEEWATSIDGVKNVKVIPLWDGPGTVKVIISDEDNRPVSNEIIEECADYIDSVRPIGAEVTVTTPEIFNVDISLNVILAPDYSLDIIKNDIKEKIDKYLIQCNGEIIYTKVGSIVSGVDGVRDYSLLLINGDIDNIEVLSDYAPQLNNLNITGGV